ncbi:peptidoglycan recognition family protein [Imperialibacter roseus]|uniref:N-acetylmuramoyl-L-alanine amidase n=1 Tax=Imperialibacter roseus TaxID=1324217 RepID=A0ABZ0ILQ8_9BACT|nr:peptidoglycan recognition family protein [Imperialibacter roseus]WOK04701.1 peptidoglycan recognition family protein [Imperialibacter roseus]
MNDYLTTILSINSRSSLLFILLVFISVLSNCDNASGQQEKKVVSTVDFAVDTIPTLNATKLELTKQYCLENYGVASYKLDSPKIVLVHFTVIPTLEETVEYFQKDSIESSRTNISKFSQMNVGIHYIVDKDGSIYKLVPDTVIARHAIGFNHVSIGIENIAKDAADLTPAQLESNVKLIAVLKERNPGLEYLVGHHEYNDISLAHYKLFLAVDESYKPHNKPDPGPKFIADLREKLKAEHNLTFMK